MSTLDWNILDTGVRTAQENMQIDAELLASLEVRAAPILHFYDWKRDSATYGLLVRPSDYLNLDAVKRAGLDLAKRPTGGGIVFHIWDLAFSVLIPAGHPHFHENTLDNYAFINEAVLRAVSDFLESRSSLELIPHDGPAFDSSCERFCMAQPTKYDVVLQGKKIAGAAQRKTKKGYLHQGTIALKMPSEEYLNAILRPETKVLEAIQAHTNPLLKTDEDLGEGRKTLRENLTKHLIREPAYVTKT
ncbi:MAG: Octanoyltransferase LipM [Chlamydiae bacterium]|nr:Octanoyltransferase LipM [Chlamydiota bacterium]